MANENLEDKKRQRDKYEILVDSDIKSINFNTDSLDNFLKFFFGTIVLGAFYMWCSSNMESNFFVYMENYRDIYYKIIILLPTIFWIIYLILLIKKAIAIKNRINIKNEQKYVVQRRIFGEFIKKKICNNDKEISIKDALKLFRDAEKDINFEFNDFVQYIDSYLMKYKLTFPYNFSRNFSYLILYNEEINGTLIKQYGYEYTFILKENEDFIMRM